MVKNKSVILAVVANIVVLGLGYLYVGRAKLAIGMPILVLSVNIVSSWSGFIFTPLGFAITLGVIIGLYLLAAIDSGIIAFKQKAARQKIYQRWFVYIAFIVIAAIGYLIIIDKRAQILGYATYRLSSGSMANTLKTGDFIMTNPRVYTEETPPERGDIIVFRYPPKPSVMYVKRLIGLPNDTVKIESGKLFVNGEEQTEHYLDNKTSQRFSVSKSSTYTVPNDAYFVLGDNRDNSNDSRFWGFVPKENLHAKVNFIWFSYDSKNGIRTSRIGTHPK